MKKPNIVYVLADQLCLRSVGYAGDSFAQTPEIDTLSRESLNCANMVSSMPVCSAYRASLFTGKYVTSTGMVINELRMNPDHRCLAHCLTDVGYDTGYIGKWHLWANELGNHHDPKNSFIPPGPHRLGFDGYWRAYNFHHEYFDMYCHGDSPERLYYGEGSFEPDAQTNMAIDFIENSKESDKPFFLFLSYGAPHDPWTPDNVPKEWFDKFKDVDIPLAETFSEENLDAYGDAWSDIPKTAEQVKEWMRVYYAMTANLDANIGRLRRSLEENGLWDDTIFVFTSDHGEMFGAHGRMKKNIFYDEAVRVPFLISWPNALGGPRVVDAPLSNVDVMPTLLGMVGIEIPEEVEGFDASDLLIEGRGGEPDFAFLQNTGACAAWEDGHEWRGIRDKRFTYAVFRVDGKEYLFDNALDPRQSMNLAGIPDYAEVLEDFRRKLKSKMRDSRDEFRPSSWYRDNWISPDREILDLSVR